MEMWIFRQFSAFAKAESQWSRYNRPTCSVQAINNRIQPFDIITERNILFFTFIPQNLLLK